jgi:hypothetical protein
MERASVLLAEANTIQDVKEFRALALSAEVYAKQRGLGKETEQRCYAYAARALIKLGVILKATESDRAKGTRGQLKGSVDGSGRTSVVLPEKTDSPTLADLGLATQNHAAAIKILAECRAGQLLKAMGLKPGRKSGNGNGVLPKEVSKIQSSRWQVMAPLAGRVRGETGSWGPALRLVSGVPGHDPGRTSTPPA